MEKNKIKIKLKKLVCEGFSPRIIVKGINS
jgi:hypothetical protein